MARTRRALSFTGGASRMAGGPRVERDCQRGLVTSAPAPRHGLPGDRARAVLLECNVRRQRFRFTDSRLNGGRLRGRSQRVQGIPKMCTRRHSARECERMPARIAFVGVREPGRVRPCKRKCACFIQDCARCRRWRYLYYPRNGFRCPVNHERCCGCYHECGELKSAPVAEDDSLI